MLTELFRREAIDHRRHRLYGEVLLTTPLQGWMTTALMSAVAAAALAVLLLGSYVRKETVAGWVTPDKGLARVSAAT
jgi:membrane fusion protein